MFKTFSLLPIVAMAANWQAGECPQLHSDMDDFNPRHMTGLWFEYVWTEGFTEGNNYRCSSWTVLENGGLDVPMIVFNNQVTEVDGDQSFYKIDLMWVPEQPQAKYTRDVPEGSEAIGERTLTVLRTNYFSYAVAASCAERDGENGKEHVLDYVVMSRDKQASVLMRKLARQACLDHGISSEQIEQMVKSKNKGCFGKDFYE